MRAVTAGWLENRDLDIAFIGGCLLLASLTVGIVLVRPELFMPLMLIDIWLLGYHHVISTYTKMAGTAQDRKNNVTLIWVWLPLMVGLTLALGLTYGTIVVVTVYFFWQWFHYVRQSWGIAQRYRRKAGGMAWDNERLSEITLWSIPIWGVLNRCYQQSDVFLFLPVWLPPVPLFVVQIAGAISIALVSWWVVTRLRAWQRGELALGHTLFMVTHMGVFLCGYVLVDDINTGWLMANVWHNSQYIFFVWLHNRQRFAGGVSAEAPGLSWLSQPGPMRAFAYFTVCVGLSSIAYVALHAIGAELNQVTQTSAVSFVVIFSMAINFHHYVVDGIIWKRRREAALAK